MLLEPINLAIMDDQIIFRKILEDYLSQNLNINVVFGTSDPFELLNKLATSSVKILLVDVLMSELSPDNLLQSIHNEFPAIKILVLSMCSDIDVISNLLHYGIQGYISKSDEPEELLHAIKSVSENRIYRNKWFTEALYFNKQDNIKVRMSDSLISLSEREKKILQLIWEEKSCKEIADEVLLGIRSIEKIRQEMKEKLGVKSTIGLLKYAIDKRIIRNTYYTVI